MVRHFRPELLEPPEKFYAREIGMLSRPNRAGWSSAPCPFHHHESHGRKRSTSFGVRLDSGAFKCLSCDAHGSDIVAFVMLRDGLSFKDAAQKLHAWDAAPSPATVRRLAEQDRQRKKQKLAEEIAAAERHRERMDVRDLVHLYAGIQREAGDRLDEMHAGDLPVTDVDADREWSILALAHAAERDAAFAYRMLSGLEVRDGE